MDQLCLSLLVSSILCTLFPSWGLPFPHPCPLILLEEASVTKAKRLLKIVLATTAHFVKMIHPREKVNVNFCENLFFSVWWHVTNKTQAAASCAAARAALCTQGRALWALPKNHRVLWWIQIPWDITLISSFDKCVPATVSMSQIAHEELCATGYVKHH